MMENIELADPIWLFALALLPLIAWFRGRRPVSAIAFPFAGAWQRVNLGQSSKFSTFVAYVGAILLTIALARPQYVETERQSKNKGYDIMLAIDLSGSMLTEDYTDRLSPINRLQAVKPILTEFIEKRENDRIGLVAFAGRAYTVAPLTFDHDWLARQTNRIGIDLIEEEGTAIGDAIAVAVNRLEEGAKERAGDREGSFIILLTDGDNTAGVMAPLVAGDLAAEKGFKVFSIAAGREGRVKFPRFNTEGKRIGTRYVQSTFDTRTIQEISHKTKGLFFRAEEKDTIDQAFAAIDQANKVEFEVNQYSVTTELFPYCLGAAAGCRTGTVRRVLRRRALPRRRRDRPCPAA